MSILNMPLDDQNIHLKNRIVLPPMATAKSDTNGLITKDLIEYYDRMSLGGYVGLVISEHCYVSQQGQAQPGQMSITDEQDLKGLQELASVVHNNGSKMVIQINHAGSAASAQCTGCEVIGPSAVPNPARKNAVTPQEMSRQDIEGVILDFVEAAKRVQAAGFDGVEIHASHAFLLNQFYSPLANKRLDDYGGDLTGRIRIILDIIKAVKAAVSDEFLILVRLGASDYTDGGSTVEDGIEACVAFEKAGASLLDISGGLCGFDIPSLSGQGYFRQITQAIKASVSIPVILTGGITSAQAADSLIESGSADLIGVGRAMLKDPTWAKKAIDSLG